MPTLPLLLLLACRVAEVTEPCLDDPELCPPCSSDDECSLQGNPCLETVACAHEDAGLAFVQIGCSKGTEYAWPEPEVCQCVDEVCQAP